MSTSENQLVASFMLNQLLEFANARQTMQRRIQFDMVCDFIYDHREEPCKVDGQLLSKLMAQRARGESYGAIATDLNRRGVRGRYGARWYASSVRALLKRVFNQENLIR